MCGLGAVGNSDQGSRADSCHYCRYGTCNHGIISTVTGNMYICVGPTTDPNLQHSGSKGGRGRMGNDRLKGIG